MEGFKQDAARAALERIRDGMVLGLGTGSTVRYFLEYLGERIRTGQLRDVVGVPTSEETAARSRAFGVPLTTLEEEPLIDVVVDGADEVDPELNLIKGAGGALLREKIVAVAARRRVIVVDERKVVPRLGTRSPLPVEVVPFGWSLHLSFLDELGAEPVLRTGPGGVPYRTDEGNYLLDCRFPRGIRRPARLERALRGRVGIVETGLFLGLADEVIVAGEGGIRSLHRAGGRA